MQNIYCNFVLVKVQKLGINKLYSQTDAAIEEMNETVEGIESNLNGMHNDNEHIQSKNTDYIEVDGPSFHVQSLEFYYENTSKESRF